MSCLEWPHLSCSCNDRTVQNSGPEAFFIISTSHLLMGKHVRFSCAHCTKRISKSAIEIHNSNFLLHGKCTGGDTTDKENESNGALTKQSSWQLKDIQQEADCIKTNALLHGHDRNKTIAALTSLLDDVDQIHVFKTTTRDLKAAVRDDIVKSINLITSNVSALYNYIFLE